MSAPSLTQARSWPADVQVCDRCLALSQLTVTLARVPRLRLVAPMTEPDDGTDPVPVVFPAPLVPCADGLRPTPGDLVRAVDDVLPDRAAAVASQQAKWSADAVRQAAVDANLAAFCMCSGEYPQPLLELTDPPPVIYTRGDRAIFEHCPAQAVGMVGTRHPTLVGRETARRIAGGIARCDGTIVSGMALGIDAASHEGALMTGGLTIAVLASGADRPSPSSHRDLYAQILDRGAVISEMPPGIQPFRWSFPARNRIIAALSRATVVVEAPLRSGALITAEQATDMGRDVYAVPGSIASDVSEGTNRLLQDGAGAVIDGAHLAQYHLGLGKVIGAAGAPAGGVLAEVHETLARGPLSIAELSRRTETSLGPGELELVLLDLELAGWVARRPDGRYRVVDRWHP